PGAGRPWTGRPRGCGHRGRPVHGLPAPGGAQEEGLRRPRRGYRSELEADGPPVRRGDRYIVANPPLRKRATLTKDFDGWITVDDGDEELFAVRVTEQLKAASPDIAVGDLVIVARGVSVVAGDLVLATAAKSSASLVRATGPGGPEVIGRVIEVRRNLRGKEAR